VRGALVVSAGNGRDPVLQCVAVAAGAAEDGHRLSLGEGRERLDEVPDPRPPTSRINSMERVWDYPRPPIVVPCVPRVRVVLASELLADSTQALRVLETSHPPTIYIPLADVREQFLEKSRLRPSWCEYKGAARYLDAIVYGRRVEAIGWGYPDPSPGYEELRDHLAFYPGRVDEAWMGNERVQAQEGDFYGGWITSELVGPFKGPSGTLGW